MRICRAWRDKSRCRYGDDCKFIHLSRGESAPEDVPRHSSSAWEQRGNRWIRVSDRDVAVSSGEHAMSGGRGTVSAVPAAGGVSSAKVCNELQRFVGTGSVTGRRHHVPSEIDAGIFR